MRSAPLAHVCADAPADAPIAHASPRSATALVRLTTPAKIGAVVATPQQVFSTVQRPLAGRSSDSQRAGSTRPCPPPHTSASRYFALMISSSCASVNLSSLDSTDAAPNAPPLTLALSPSTLTFSPLLFSNSEIVWALADFFLISASKSAVFASTGVILERKLPLSSSLSAPHSNFAGVPFSTYQIPTSPDFSLTRW